MVEVGDLLCVDVAYEAGTLRRLMWCEYLLLLSSLRTLGLKSNLHQPPPSRLVHPFLNPKGGRGLWIGGGGSAESVGQLPSLNGFILSPYDAH